MLEVDSTFLAAKQNDKTFLFVSAISLFGRSQNSAIVRDGSQSTINPLLENGRNSHITSVSGENKLSGKIGHLEDRRFA